jgi:hypothetical protein
MNHERGSHSLLYREGSSMIQVCKDSAAWRNMVTTMGPYLAVRTKRAIKAVNSFAGRINKGSRPWQKVWGKLRMQIATPAEARG